MAGAMQRDGIDVEPQPATCDVCRHRHACFVGGYADGTDAGSTSWETHVCLGCLMRAAPMDGLDACDKCPVGSADPVEASAPGA